MQAIIVDFFDMCFALVSAWVSDSVGLLTALVSVFCFVIWPFKWVLKF